jgi:hypothetical protein
MNNWVPTAVVDCGQQVVSVAFGPTAASFAAASTNALTISTEAPLCTACRPPQIAFQTSPTSVSVFGPSSTHSFSTTLSPVGLDVTDATLVAWSSDVVEVHALAGGKCEKIFCSALPLGVAAHGPHIIRCSQRNVELVSATGVALGTFEVPLAMGLPVAVAVAGNSLAVITSTASLMILSIRGRILKETVSGKLKPAGGGGITGANVKSMRLSSDGKRIALMVSATGEDCRAEHSKTRILVHDFDTDSTLELGALTRSFDA